MKGECRPVNEVRSKDQNPVSRVDPVSRPLNTLYPAPFLKTRRLLSIAPTAAHKSHHRRVLVSCSVISKVPHQSGINVPHVRAALKKQLMLRTSGEWVTGST